MALETIDTISTRLVETTSEDGGSIEVNASLFLKLLREIQGLRRNYLALRGEIEDVRSQLYEAENQANEYANELQERRNNDESIFPGVMRCPICDFSRTHVNVTPTGNYAGKSVQEDCPNGCGPMRADKYRRQYNDLYDHAQELKRQLEAATSKLQERRKAEAPE